MCRKLQHESTRKQKKVRQLDEIDRELLKMRLESPGRCYTDLAQEIGLSMTVVAHRCTKPEFRQALADLQKKALDIIIDAKEIAARRLVALIECKNESVAIRACENILADLLPAKKVALSGDLKIESFQYSEMRAILMTRIEKISANGSLLTGHDN